MKSYKIFLKGWGYLLLAEILSLFISVTLAFFDSIIFKILSIICTLGILIGVTANFGYSVAKSDKMLEKKLSYNHKKNRAFVLSFVTIIPLLVLWGILLISWLGVIGDFYPAYKLITAFFIQIYYFISISSDFSAIKLILMLLLNIVPFISIFVSYNMTYYGISLENLFYSKNNK